MTTKKKAPTFDDVVQEALRLSPIDKVRLIERLASVLKYDVAPQAVLPRQSLHGALADLGPAPSEEDIAEVRREVWRNFPRDDIA
jgi:hypothetical protein